MSEAFFTDISESLGISMIPKLCQYKSLFHRTSKGEASVGEVNLDVCTGFCAVSEGEQSRVVSGQVVLSHCL